MSRDCCTERSSSYGVRRSLHTTVWVPLFSHVSQTLLRSSTPLSISTWIHTVTQAEMGPVPHPQRMRKRPALMLSAKYVLRISLPTLSSRAFLAKTSSACHVLRNTCALRPRIPSVRIARQVGRIDFCYRCCQPRG